MWVSGHIMLCVDLCFILSGIHIGLLCRPIRRPLRDVVFFMRQMEQTNGKRDHQVARPIGWGEVYLNGGKRASKHSRGKQRGKNILQLLNVYKSGIIVFFYSGFFGNQTR